MTSSSRCPLTPRQLAVVAAVVSEREKASCARTSLQLVLASGLIKEQGAQICASHYRVPIGSLLPGGCRVQRQSRCSAGNMDVVPGRGEGRGGQRCITPPFRVRCEHRGSGWSFRFKARCCVICRLGLSFRDCARHFGVNSVSRR